jgi:hypothetical protein
MLQWKSSIEVCQAQRVETVIRGPVTTCRHHCDRWQNFSELKFSFVHWMPNLLETTWIWKFWSIGLCIDLLLHFQAPGSKAEREGKEEIPAMLRCKIWLGQEKEEHAWSAMQTEGELAVFAETVRNYFILSVRGVILVAISKSELCSSQCMANAWSRCLLEHIKLGKYKLVYEHRLILLWYTCVCGWKTCQVNAR